MPTLDISPELRQRRHLPSWPIRKPPVRYPEEAPAGGWQGMQWKVGVGARQAGKVVSFQLHSPQVGRILTPWTERQTDKPHVPFSLVFQALQGLSASVILRSCRRCGHDSGSWGRGDLGPAPTPHTSTYLQGYSDRDIQVHTKHAPMPINTHTHTRTDMYHSPGSLCIWRHWMNV